MRHFILSFILFFGYHYSTAQKTDSSFSKPVRVLTEVEFLTAKSAYLKMSLSDTYKSNRAAVRLLAKNLSKIKNKEQIVKNDTLFSRWVSENLNLTNFKSVDEAVALRKLCIESQEKLMNDNPDVFLLLPRASRSQYKEIMIPSRATRAEIEEMRK